MAQDGPETRANAMSLPHAPLPKMPKEIAKAVIEAIDKIEAAQATGEGEEGTRAFRYASINDVLEAAHQALKDVGLAVSPIEVSYSEDVVDLGLKQLWARHGYRFRYIHKSGETWVDEEDTRHLSIPINSNGMSAGKAQSLALRDYLKGLLRIRTAEPDAEPDAQNVSRETLQRSGVRPPAPAAARGPNSSPTIPMSFAPGNMQPHTVKSAQDAFDQIVAPLSPAKRRQWEDANEEGLRQLKELSGPAWFHIRKAIDRKE